MNTKIFNILIEIKFKKGSFGVNSFLCERLNREKNSRLKNI